jgi:transposase
MTMPAVIERAHDDAVDESPPADRPRRRRFTPAYKLAILADYDRLSGVGEKGALLRREGLYSSHIVEWRRAREAGMLHGSASTPAVKAATGGEAALAKANRRADRAEAELAKTRMALEIMGKAHALLEMLAEGADSDPKSKG